MQCQAWLPHDKIWHQMLDYVVGIFVVALEFDGNLLTGIVGECSTGIRVSVWVKRRILQSIF